MEFSYLKSALELTAGNLSRHITVLEQAGLIEVEKGYEGSRPRTWLHITDAGRAELAEMRRCERCSTGTTATKHQA